MTRRKFTSKFKTQVVLEALKERMSMAELAQKFKLNPVQISAWKKEFLQKRGRLQQWVNQEIGFAYALQKLDSKRFAFVEDKILNVLKGFVHSKLQLPFQFKVRGKDCQKNFWQMAYTFAWEIEKQVIEENHIIQVNS